jgi:acyl-CoA thioesterase FadM
VKTHALMQYMQEAAACHAEQLGLGIRELERRGCLWVLVNLRIEMSYTPGWGDEVIVATCDLDFGAYIKRTIFNFAKHRRVEHYKLITERTGAVPPPEE